MLQDVENKEASSAGIYGKLLFLAESLGTPWNPPESFRSGGRNPRGIPS